MMKVRILRGGEALLVFLSLATLTVAPALWAQQDGSAASSANPFLNAGRSEALAAPGSGPADVSPSASQSNPFRETAGTKPEPAAATEPVKSAKVQPPKAVKMEQPRAARPAPASSSEIEDLRKVVQQQAQQLNQQQQQLARQTALLEQLQQHLARSEKAAPKEAAAAVERTAAAKIEPEAPAEPERKLAQAQPPPAAAPQETASAGPAPAAPPQTPKAVEKTVLVDQAQPAGQSLLPPSSPIKPNAEPATPPDGPALESRLEKLEKALTKDSPETLKAYWKEGIRLDSVDKSFQLRLGGRVMNDWGFFSPSSGVESGIGAVEGGTEFRRARAYVSGLIYNRAIFKVEYDYAGGSANFTDVYLGVVKMPLIGNVRVGHFKEPFSLEALTNSNYLTFQERALPNAFAPARNTGVMVHNGLLKERLNWALGVFRDADAFGNGAGSGDYNFTGRLTGQPWTVDKGRRLLHLGVAYSYRDPLDDSVRFRAKPEANLSPRFIDTKSFSARALNLLGTEAAVVWGSTSLQTEYIHTFVNRPTDPNVSFGGYYVQVSHFLTGEHRVYKSSDAAFDRVKPIHSLGSQGEGRRGAWEVAVRYSQLNLNDRLILGGELQDVTFGLNWYLNPNTRIMWNYVLADRVEIGRAGLFQSRFQVDF